MTKRKPTGETPDISAKGAIWSSQARVTDRKAFETLLAPLPAAIATDVRKLARSGRNKSGMRYDAASRCAFWLEHGSDGVLSCFTFERVANLETAAEMWQRFDDAAPIRPEQMYEIFSRVTGYALKIPDNCQPLNRPVTM